MAHESKGGTTALASLQLWIITCPKTPEALWAKRGEDGEVYDREDIAQLLRRIDRVVDCDRWPYPKSASSVEWSSLPGLPYPVARAPGHGDSAGVGGGGAVEGDPGDAAGANSQSSVGSVELDNSQPMDLD